MNTRLIQYLIILSVICGCSSPQVTPAQIRSTILEDRTITLKPGEYLLTTPFIPAINGKNKPDGTVVCYGYRLQALQSDRLRFKIYSPCRRVFLFLRSGVLKTETIEDRELGTTGQLNGAIDSKIIIAQDENLIAAIKHGDARSYAGYRSFYMAWRLENRDIAGFIEANDESFTRWLGLKQ
jgi:hypothetical protein